MHVATNVLLCVEGVSTNMGICVVYYYYFFTKRACPILIICMDKETYSYLYTCMRGGDFVFGFLKEGFDGACNDGLCTVFITY